METVVFDYKYTFKYANISLDDHCIGSKVFKGKVCIISRRKADLNLKFHHSPRELIWFARLNGL